MPASASADFFDVSSRSSRAHTQKNARQKRKYKKKEEDRDSNCIWRLYVARKIRANDLLVVSSSPARSSPSRTLRRQNEEMQRSRGFCRKEKRTTKIHTREGRTRFLHRRPAVRSASPRTRGRRNRSSVRSQGSAGIHLCSSSFSSSKSSQQLPAASKTHHNLSLSFESKVFKKKKKNVFLNRYLGF